MSLQLLPVAQYLRMSTEHQRYSIVNQAEQIAVYAKQHDMAVVKTYADEGKSGLDAVGRGAFLRLISDVVNGQSEFHAVLVLDVSRWGRFQNTDESAHYEYLCTRSGVPVMYCSELFSNDGTPLAALLKNIKRSMDGEYSRQLSVKVFVGHCRLARMGFFQGGPVGYGLRRRLLSPEGVDKGVLLLGERKSIHRDRVVIRPGPPNETRRVRAIFRAYAEEGKTEVQIAQDLNRRHILTELGRPWARQSVHRVLTNERYLGQVVYNRTATKLRTESVQNPPELWIRSEHLFAPIVEPGLFEKVQAQLAMRSGYSDEEMLRMLRELAARTGKAAAHLIDAEPGMPCAATYRMRFGSLPNAYARAGLPIERNFDYIEVRRRLKSTAIGLATELASLQTAAGLRIEQTAGRGILFSNKRAVTAVVAVRCTVASDGASFWRIPVRESRCVETLVIVRMDEDNVAPMDFHLLPRKWFTLLPLQLSKNGGRCIAAYRCKSLSEVSSRLATNIVGGSL